MGEEETLGQQRSSFAAPLILLIVLAFQFVSKWLEQLKKRGLRSDTEIQLRREIKQILKEASSYSQPSTFAQAAKLKRLAAAKEKELANYQELQSKEIHKSYDLYLKILRILKVVIYFVLVCWFWRAPVAAISQQLVQPFGKFLSWRTEGLLNNNVMVGIIPWLILSTRVSKFVCGLFKPSTFAQTAKLKRLAAAKEKELANYQELQSKEIHKSYDLYLKVLRILKVVIYFVLVCWFWRAPVAAISQQLVQPFGKFLSWRTGGFSNKNVMAGIIPWLILSTRVNNLCVGSSSREMLW